MLDASTVPMEAYERLLAEYRALVEHVQLPCLSAERFRRCKAILAMGERELGDADARAPRRSQSRSK